MSSSWKASGRFATTTSIQLILVFLAVVLLATLCQAANPPACTTGILPQGTGADIDVMGGTCFVDASNSPYNYGNINIYGGGSLCFVDRGDGKSIDFWAKSILVEDKGSFLSSDATMCSGGKASIFGASGATLKIHLYGPDQGTGPKYGANKGPGQGIACHSSAHCNIPDSLWNSNPLPTDIHHPPTSCMHASKTGYGMNLPGGVDDCFYAYEPLIYDTAGSPPGYFGYKVLAVSFNGSLQLFGAKGATYDALSPSDSGGSWRRLTQSLGGASNEQQFTIDWPKGRNADWVAGDKIVITTTDYLPAHSETLTIANFSLNADKTVATVTVQETVQYPHNGITYDLSKSDDKVPDGIGPDQDPSIKCSGTQTRCIETRAAVGLLNRSIQIVSGGDTFNSYLPDPDKDKCTGVPDPAQLNSCFYFGGHTIVRQGFLTFQVQGVEFYQMAQGARIMHYPVHFHMARRTPQGNGGTFIADSSIWDSMNRWITVHATQGVTLARNVGYKSIGHGFYLEDATESENKLYTNLGVLVRAAVDNKINNRHVPGILYTPHYNPGDDEIPFHTDTEHPTAFWITNAWNDFQYNMAAGTEACGMCYWVPPSVTSGMSRYQYWDYYAGEQKYYQFDRTTDATLCGHSETQTLDSYQRDGTTPLQNFVGNSCVASQNSFITIGNTSPCNGIIKLQDRAYMPPIVNDLAPVLQNPACFPLSKEADAYYPKVDAGGVGRRATKCPGGEGNDCEVNPCSFGQEDNCVVNVLDHYTSSLTWAQTNISAVWLRPQWYLLSNSAITDTQNGGLTFVSGGGYSGSDEIPGYWALAHKNAFVGNTQTTNPFAMNAGPFNPDTKKLGLKCDDPFIGAGFCLNQDQGVIFPLDNFAVNQRLFNIYDGPAYQSANAYLDISKTVLDGCTKDSGAGCPGLGWIYGNTAGVLQDSQQSDPTRCYQPNAAIAWKQPNGFYYPPAFHSDTLFFNKKVDIRHFVIEPLFLEGTYTDNSTLIGERYCANTNFLNDWTDVDRQTELSDDDGSLTGLLGTLNDTTNPTISVNKDPFYRAPTETPECASDIQHNIPPPLGSCTYGDPKSGEALCATANTSPYHYVTNVLFPCLGEYQVPGDFACQQASCPDGANNCWQKDCKTQLCSGVPLYRFDRNYGENKTDPLKFLRMSGQGTGQRSALTLDHGLYYLDTTVSADKQFQQRSLFAAKARYGFFLLYAQPTTTQTYKVYVGSGFNVSSLKLDRVDQHVTPPTFMPVDSYSFPVCTDTVKSQCYTYTDPYLTVNLDMSKIADFEGNYELGKKNHCAPASFCTWTGDEKTGSCGCAHGAEDGECENACKNWAVKDVNCPEGGCYGFEFKLPDDFKANNQGTPDPSQPQWQPSCFNPTNDSYWNTAFQLEAGGNNCDYTGKVPTAQFCTDNMMNKLLNTGSGGWQH
ncbi:MAG: hypothetical protein ACLPND_13050 [Candidatus Korobacteraceae bacterium]